MLCWWQLPCNILSFLIISNANFYVTFSHRTNIVKITYKPPSYAQWRPWFWNKEQYAVYYSQKYVTKARASNLKVGT
jgi:hypothetical protein